MKLPELKSLLGEIILEEILNKKDLVGPYTVHVKKGRLAGQTVMANLNQKTGIYYYLNPDTGHDEPIGDETSVDVQKQNVGEGKQNVDASLMQFAKQHPEIIKQMREWTKDCQWRDVEDESDVDEFSDIQILQGVNRYYEGGIRQFIADANPQQQLNEAEFGSKGYWVDLEGNILSVDEDGSHRDYAKRVFNKDPDEAFFHALKLGWVRMRQYRHMGLEVEYEKINDVQEKTIMDFAAKNKLRILRGNNGKHVEEGVGYVYAKDREKDPKSIKKGPDAVKDGGSTKHWTIKFQSANDLKKHGDTEKSPVTETIKKSDVKSVIKDLISEMWMDIATGGKEKKGPTGRGTEPGADEPFVSLYKGGPRTGGASVYSGGKGDGASEMLPSTGGAMSEAVDDFELGKQKAILDFRNKVPYKKNPVGMSARWIEGYKFAYGTLRRAERMKTPPTAGMDAGTPRVERDSQADFGLQEVTMPHSQQTPPDTMKLWKLIEQLEVGQFINFYNPKNPNPNTTAPWVYIKKILTTDDGGEEAYGYNLSIEPRMDWKPTSVALRGFQGVETGEDVTEDEVSVALEIVEQNRNILSMYYIETEDAPRKRRPYQGDPDRDIGDYERFGPDHIRAQDVTESKVNK
jgi:hypothetical protein